MKRLIKIFSILITIAVLFSSIQATFTANAAGEQEIYYYIKNNKAIVECQPTWVIGDIVISSSYEGYPVTGFSEPYSAYIFCSGVTSITLPNTIDEEELTGFPFCGCPTAEIIISADNPNLCLEGNVLYNKDKTKLIRYQDNPNSKSFTIPESVVEVSEFAFTGSNLEELTILNKAINIRGNCDDGFGGHDIKNVYYNGTEEEWISNKIDEYSSMFPNTTIHFEEKTPESSVPDEPTSPTPDEPTSPSDSQSIDTEKLLIMTFEFLCNEIIPLAGKLIAALAKLILTLIK